MVDPAPARDRVSVLVVRVWAQAEAPGLRARLTEVLDVDDGEMTVATVAGRRAIVAAVEAWLRRVADSGRE
jgi:hypothetical protein